MWSKMKCVRKKEKKKKENTTIMLITLSSYDNSLGGAENKAYTIRNFTMFILSYRLIQPNKHK